MGKWKQIPLETVKQMLKSFWRDNPAEWRQYHALRNFLKKQPQLRNASERTIMRYLAELCREGFLEKRVEPTHRTWYRLHKPLLPLLFEMYAADYILGLKKQNGKTQIKIEGGEVCLREEFEDEYAGLSLAERFEVISRRFFAFKLFCLIKHLETENDSWEPLAGGLPFTPLLLSQLGIRKLPSPAAYGTGRFVADLPDDNSLFKIEEAKIRLTDETVEKLKVNFRKAMPEEFKVLEDIYSQCLKQVGS